MKDWKELNEDTILNWEEAHTGMKARYERIMSRKLRDSIVSFTESFNKHVKELKDSVNSFNETSAKLSSRLCWLNGILVFLTVVLVIFGFLSLFPKTHWIFKWLQ